MNVIEALVRDVTAKRDEIVETWLQLHRDHLYEVLCEVQAFDPGRAEYRCKRCGNKLMVMITINLDAGVIIKAVPT